MEDWSSLAQEAGAQARTRGPKCQVGLLLASLPDTAADHLRNALTDKNLGAPGLYRALRIRLGDDAVPTLWSIGNHRRGNCACSLGRRA